MTLVRVEYEPVTRFYTELQSKANLGFPLPNNDSSCLNFSSAPAKLFAERILR